MDLSVEAAGVRGVVRAHGRAGLVADVGRLVCREDEALRLIDPALADFLAGDEQGDVAALAVAAAVVRELHAYLGLARGNRRAAFDRVGRDAEHVVDELGLAALRVEAPSAEAPALSDEHALCRALRRPIDVGRDRERLVLDADDAVLGQPPHARRRESASCP